MKRIFFALLVASCLLRPTAAMAVPTPCPLPNDPNVLIDFLWPVIDTSGNGSLSFEEAQAVYPPLMTYLFDLADSNRDGRLTRNEVLPFLPLLPVDYLGFIDTNGDGVLQPSEVSGYTTNTTFASLDKNNNGVIDCGDLDGAAPEGQVEEGETEAPCPIPPDPRLLLDTLWPFAARDGNGGLTLAEVQVFEPSIDITLFNIVDINRDGKVTRAEIEPFIGLLPADFLSEIDLNNDGIIAYHEVSGYVTQAQFNALDKNNNGVIDCGDLDDTVEPEGSTEGEPFNPCAHAGILISAFGYGDTNNDGALTLDEFTAYTGILGSPLDYTPVWHAANTAEDLRLTTAEFNAFLSNCNLPHEGEPEGKPEGEYEGGYIDLCAYVQNFDYWFDFADINKDGGITLNEVHLLLTQVNAVYPDLDLAFTSIDSDNNGAVTRAELAFLLTLCGYEGEPEGHTEGETEGANGNELCALVPLAQSQFDFADLDKNGIVSEAELGQIIIIMIYPAPDISLLLDLLDTDGDRGISRAELDAFAKECEGGGGYPTPCDFITFYGADAIALYDANNDGKLSYAELPVISFFAPPVPNFEALFAAVDANNDSKIDATELAALADRCANAEGQPEGETEGGGETWLPCEYAPILVGLFPQVDTNKDGSVTLAEISAILINIVGPGEDLSTLFNAIDLNNDGGITLPELRQALSTYCNLPGEGEPEGAPEGQPEGEPEGQGGNGDAPLQIARHLLGNGFYLPGGTIDLEIIISRNGAGNITALGISETLPQGWALADILDDGGAVALPPLGATGTLEIAWLQVPTLPAKFRYRLAVPAESTGLQLITGQAVYRIGDSEEESTLSLATAIPEGFDATFCHASDYDNDWRISLSEVLRLIQFFNSGQYHCGDGTEDGYASGDGPRACQPHSSDYVDGNWKISLSELLRLVQLYNVDGGIYFFHQGTEDGFAPGRYQNN